MVNYSRTSEKRRGRLGERCQESKGCLRGWEKELGGTTDPDNF